jgi:hypothetical protein
MTEAAGDTNGNLALAIARLQARGDVENLFSRYMLLHNAFRDEEIIDLWVKPETPGIRAQYSEKGSYTTWDSVMAYHRGRPTPVGKLILHYTTTPVIEVAADARTAKGMWIMMGLESGVMTDEEAAKAPERLFTPGRVQGKRVWAHWVWARYGLDFLNEDGVWKIWHFRCDEIARAPYHENWISYMDKDRDSLALDLAYFGEDGEPVFMPEPDASAIDVSHRYRPELRTELIPEPPRPYRTFDETFSY